MVTLSSQGGGGDKEGIGQGKCYSVESVKNEGRTSGMEKRDKYIRRVK